MGFAVVGVKVKSLPPRQTAPHCPASVTFPTLQIMKGQGLGVDAAAAPERPLGCPGLAVICWLVAAGRLVLTLPYIL